MKHISFDQTDGTFLSQESCLQDWSIEDRDDNDTQLSRLRRNLILARSQVLTPRQQEILIMRYDQHMKVRAIARALHVNPSTVSRTIHRAESRLRAHLRYSF